MLSRSSYWYCNVFVAAERFKNANSIISPSPLIAINCAWSIWHKWRIATKGRHKASTNPLLPPHPNQMRGTGNKTKLQCDSTSSSHGCAWCCMAVRWAGANVHQSTNVLYFFVAMTAVVWRKEGQRVCWRVDFPNGWDKWKCYKLGSFQIWGNF